MIRKKRLITQISAASDIGRGNVTNQDNIFIMRPPLRHTAMEHFSSADMCGVPVLAVLSDGMGGTMMGERASFLAVSHVAKLDMNKLRQKKTKELVQYLQQIFLEINQEIYSEYVSLGMNIGCTMTLLYIDDKRMLVLNVGDSPCIKFDESGYQVLSHIDNRANLMYEQGMISEQERWTHPMKNQLSQYMGMNPGVSALKPHIYLEKRMKKNAIYLLCSDGVIEGMNFRMIEQMLKEEYQPDIARRLVDCAIQGGSRDNVSAIVVSVLAGK